MCCMPQRVNRYVCLRTVSSRYRAHIRESRSQWRTESVLILSLSRVVISTCLHTGTSGERLHCAQLSTRNSSIDALSSSDNGIVSPRSNGRTRAYLSNGRRNSDESVMTDMRREVRASFDAALI